MCRTRQHLYMHTTVNQDAPVAKPRCDAMPWGRFCLQSGLKHPFTALQSHLEANENTAEPG